MDYAARGRNGTALLSAWELKGSSAPQRRQGALYLLRSPAHYRLGGEQPEGKSGA
jgi:hypothetical protein